MYPTPTDLQIFEQRYANEHVPMAIEKLSGKTRFVASLITASVGNEPCRFTVLRKFIFPPWPT